MTRLERRARQVLIDALLAEVAEERQTLYRLQASGVQPAGARSVHEDLQRSHELLRQYVDLQNV